MLFMVQTVMKMQREKLISFFLLLKDSYNKLRSFKSFLNK
jgi:hypothetical protein